MPSPLRIMREAAKELNVAWATNGGRRLCVLSNSVHRVNARIRSAGNRTGSRCSREKSADDASAETTKDALLAVGPKFSLPTDREETKAPSR